MLQGFDQPAFRNIDLSIRAPVNIYVLPSLRAICLSSNASNEHTPSVDFGAIAQSVNHVEEH